MPAFERLRSTRSVLVGQRFSERHVESEVDLQKVANCAITYLRLCVSGLTGRNNDKTQIGWCAVQRMTDKDLPESPLLTPSRRTRQQLAHQVVDHPAVHAFGHLVVRIHIRRMSNINA